LETTCRDWFRRFKDGKFDIGHKKHENWTRKVEDYKFQAIDVCK